MVQETSECVWGVGKNSKFIRGPLKRGVSLHCISLGQNYGRKHQAISKSAKASPHLMRQVLVVNDLVIIKQHAQLVTLIVQKGLFLGSKLGIILPTKDRGGGMRARGIIYVGARIGMRVTAMYFPCAPSKFLMLIGLSPGMLCFWGGKARVPNNVLRDDPSTRSNWIGTRWLASSGRTNQPIL